MIHFLPVERFNTSATFIWTEQRTKVAVSLASGSTKQEAADAADVDRGTVYNWLSHPDFAAEVDRLSLMVDVASRAERLRLTMRAVRSKLKDGVPQSDKDILEWLKFAQSETDGVKLDLGKLAAASVAQVQTPVADSGSLTGDREGESASATDFTSEDSPTQ